MSLYFRIYHAGSEIASHESIASIKHPIVILHGLFGSSKNWVSVAKILSKDRLVYAVDQRNHGNSPHHGTHTLNDMVDDLREFLLENAIMDSIVLGHSMGGLVAMLYILQSKSDGAFSFGKKPFNEVKGIIIQDIAPREYPFQYDQEVEAMSLDVSKANSRQEIDDLMKDLVPNSFIRQFLQMNLARNTSDSTSGSAGYFWKINLPTIVGDRKLLSTDFRAFNPVRDSSILFLLGGESEYINSEDHSMIRELFPNASIVEIESGGHYIHYTHSKEFISFIAGWLGQNNF